MSSSNKKNKTKRDVKKVVLLSVLASSFAMSPTLTMAHSSDGILKQFKQESVSENLTQQKSFEVKPAEQKAIEVTPDVIKLDEEKLFKVKPVDTKPSLEENHVELERVKQENMERSHIDTVIPLIQSITPVIGSSIVRPDQTITVQLNPNADDYHEIAWKIARGYVAGYILDGKAVVPINKSLISIDSTTGKVTVNHPLLNRYTKYAIALNFDGEGQHGQREQDGQDSDGGKTLDVVTAVDTVAKTVTLLNKGTVSLLSGNEGQKGYQGQRGNYAGFLANLIKTGNVVSVHTNNKGETHITDRKDKAASAIFETGSDLYEPTSVSLPELNIKPSVLENNQITVKATDDYGLPAQGKVSLNVNEQGSRLQNSTAFVEAPLELKEGSARFIMSDHEAEKVSFRADVAGQYGTKTEEGEITYLPGSTEKLNLTPNPSYIVGQTSSVKGTALDVYDNAVADGVKIEGSSVRGSLMATETKNGGFELSYKPSTKKGTDSLKVSAGDSRKALGIDVLNQADIPVTATVKVPSLAPGKEAILTGTVVDQYENGTGNVNVTLVGAAGSATTDDNGAYSLKFIPDGNLKEIGLTAGEQTLKIATATGELVTSLPVIVRNLDYTGNVPPANVASPVVAAAGSTTSLKVNEAFNLPTIAYDAGNFVPFYYYSEFPVVNPADFHKGVVSNGDRMWLNEWPYGGAGSLNGLVFFRSTFTMAEAGNVQVSVPSTDDATLMFIDGKPVAYNQDINYTSGFRSQGINLPPAAQTIFLEAGEHTIILETANAYYPGPSNGAHVRANVVKANNGQVLASTANAGQWTSTGYVKQPPTSWFFKPGTYTVLEELLNFWTLDVAKSTMWTLEVK